MQPSWEFEIPRSVGQPIKIRGKETFQLSQRCLHMRGKKKTMHETTDSRQKNQETHTLEVFRIK